MFDSPCKQEKNDKILIAKKETFRVKRIVSFPILSVLSLKTKPEKVSKAATPSNSFCSVLFDKS